MNTRTYRLTVIGCALAWFLVGLHAPALHGIVHHGQRPGAAALAIVAGLTLGAVAALWALLRGPRGAGG